MSQRPHRVVAVISLLGATVIAGMSTSFPLYGAETVPMTMGTGDTYRVKANVYNISVDQHGNLQLLRWSSTTSDFKVCSIPAAALPQIARPHGSVLADPLNLVVLVHCGANAWGIIQLHFGAAGELMWVATVAQWRWDDELERVYRGRTPLEFVVVGLWSACRINYGRLVCGWQFTRGGVMDQVTGAALARGRLLAGFHLKEYDISSPACPAKPENERPLVGISDVAPVEDGWFITETLSSGNAVVHLDTSLHATSIAILPKASWQLQVTAGRVIAWTPVRHHAYVVTSAELREVLLPSAEHSFDIIRSVEKTPMPEFAFPHRLVSASYTGRRMSMRGAFPWPLIGSYVTMRFFVALVVAGTVCLLIVAWGLRRESCVK